MDDIKADLTINDYNKKTSRKFNGTSAIAILALLISFATAAAALIYIYNFNNYLKVLNYSNLLLHKQMLQLQGSQGVLADQIKLQQQQLIKNQQLVSGNHKNWVFAEVNYLIRLASYNLNYGRDVPAAIALLQTADQRIAQLNDPTLTQLRQHLANATTTLQVAAKLDTVGILAKLVALQLQVKQLPLVTPTDFVTAKNGVVTYNEPATSAWRRALANSWATLKSLVIVRYHQEPIEPLLDAEQLHYLQQNLQIQLQQAQWAVLHGQQQIYQNSLQQAINWVQNYFASASPQTSTFIQNLTQLQKINIQPILPDLNPLLNTLAKVEQPVTANN